MGRGVCYKKKVGEEIPAAVVDKVFALSTAEANTKFQMLIRNIGGKENVSGLTHCITRLRFKLKDEKKAKDDVLKGMDGNKEKGSLFNRAIDVISGIFQPILGIMAACGMGCSIFCRCFWATRRRRSLA